MLKNKIESILALSAIADAMGSATENLTFEQIREKYPPMLRTFAKPDKSAFAYGNEIGEVTDDFSQVYYISKELVENKSKITTEIVKKAMIKWSKEPKYFDRFAGPTTRSAIEMYKNNTKEPKPLEGAVTVDYASKATNGAAMKISPAGILNPGNLDAAIDDAITITQVTHDNSLAISGACAVASAISESLKDNATFKSVIDAGFYGADRGLKIAKEKSRIVAGASVIKRMELALKIASLDLPKSKRLKELSEVVGSGLHISEAVPCAFGIIAINENNPLEAVIDAVNIGYDTDTIAIIVASIVGAFIDQQDRKFRDLYNKLEEVNNFKLKELSLDLYNLIND